MSESNVTPNGRNVTSNGIVGFQLTKKQKTQPFDYESQNVTPDSNDSNELIFYFPKYGVEEYINDRTIWQKQLYTIGGEQGWFYFKVFFNFNTEYGLLGGLLSTNKKLVGGRQSAMSFFASIEDRYKQEQIPHRMLALYKFGSTLKSSQTETPWVIKGINGLDQINGANVNDFGKLKAIELVMNNETTDMRIGTLLDLYKYATYDSINCKEIIPANLRKFEMTILCFHVPIKGYQTKIYSNATINKTETGKFKNNGLPKTKRSRGDVIEAKTTFLSSTSKEDFSNMMSFKMYSFKNCEFAMETLDATTPGSISNETAFNLGGQSLKINYERVYEHRMNEFGEFFMGDDGFMYNEIAPDAYIGSGTLYEGATDRYKINAAGSANMQHKRYKFIADKRNLYEFTDGVIRDANINATSWGDLNTMSIGRIGRNSTGTRINSPYLNSKLKALKEGTIDKHIPTTATRSFTKGGFNLLSDWINGITNKKKTNTSGAKQNCVGTGESRKNTDYFNEKLKNLDEGTI